MRQSVKIKSYLNTQKKRVEDALERYIPSPSAPFEQNIESMRYSLFAGGKRIRPILCLAAAEAVGSSTAINEDLLIVACALECIHTYSLIHDDLPAMDNDDLRRGKPTNHVLFGEAGAILAGDGLQSLAFELLSDAALSPSLTANQRLQITNTVAKASGYAGMVGGQALDIANERQQFPFEMLQNIHRSKTGALITASIHCGAIGAGAGSVQQQALLEYGKQIGLAFQIVDDLLNVTSTTKQLGKQAGSDAVLGKATYPSFFGIEETRKRAEKAIADAHEALADFGTRADHLRQLADYIYERSN